MVSEGAGDFAITNLGPGAYSVAIELAGFASEKRDIVLGLAQVETLDVTLGVAAVTEAVTVSLANVIDLSSAKIGVNVSPEEIRSLPVNGRNFANLMTLATGATSDGNGQASGSTASRTSRTISISTALTARMSGTQPPVPERPGLSFACRHPWIGLGIPSELRSRACGERARFRQHYWSPRAGATGSTGSLFEYKRDDAFDAASKADNEKQELSLDQFGGSLGGPVVQNHSFFFASFERLRQRTGLRFTEAVPSVEARRRIAAGEPVGSGAGQSGDRTRAVAPLAGFLGERHQRRIRSRSGDSSQADQTENTVALRVDHRFNDSQSM